MIYLDCLFKRFFQIAKLKNYISVLEVVFINYFKTLYKIDFARGVGGISVRVMLFTDRFDPVSACG